MCACAYIRVQRLPKKTAAVWADLELLCSPQVNYKAYRAVEADAKPPFIPFIGMQLRDMVFMNDGNPVQLLNGLYKYVRSCSHYYRYACLRRFC